MLSDPLLCFHLVSRGGISIRVSLAFGITLLVLFSCLLSRNFSTALLCEDLIIFLTHQALGLIHRYLNKPFHPIYKYGNHDASFRWKRL